MCGAGNSAGASRAASTAYGFRTPLVFAPAKAARACGVQPSFSATGTGEREPVPAGGRQLPVRTQRGEDSPAGPSPLPSASAVYGASHAGAAGSWVGAAARQVLAQLWELAFEQGRLAALDEFQDRFYICMK